MAGELQGIVSSAKRDKTITVSIASRETHPLYRKQYTKTRKYTAHDEHNEAGVGDKVLIAACRPISKTKNYRLVKVLEKSKDAIELKEDVVTKDAGDKRLAENKADQADTASAEEEK